MLDISDREFQDYDGGRRSIAATGPLAPVRLLGLPVEFILPLIILSLSASRVSCERGAAILLNCHLMERGLVSTFLVLLLYVV